MGPTEALKQAIRSVLLENPLLSGYTLAGNGLKEDDPLPGAEITIEGDVPENTMGPNEAGRFIKISVIWKAEDTQGVAGITQADTYNELTRDLLVKPLNGVLAIDRLNAYLVPLGYESGPPVECGGIPQHTQYAGKDRTSQRECIGHYYDFFLNRLS